MSDFIDISPASYIARVSAINNDGCRTFLQLPDTQIITVDSSEPLGLEIDTVVLVRAADNHIEVVPEYVWPSDTKPSGHSSWVGVVLLRHDDVTIIDTGVRWHSVPTNAMDYQVGNTVEGRDSLGVTRVLDKRPLRRPEAPGIDDEVIAKFKAPLGTETFDDFGGLDDVKEQALELIELPLLRDEALREIGARPIKGVLFTGDPGSGKTMLARIIANHAEAVFYEISGPEIFSKWYGESEELLRKIFEDAASQTRAIIFFDEIDSVAGQRSDDAHEASKRVVGQLLTLMDGFERDEHVVVIAATNRPDDIDVALRRPGRFDREVAFPVPDQPDREAILRAAAKGLTLREPLPHAHVASLTDGWSAAELAGIWSEAAVLAVRDNRRAIRSEDYRGGFERVAERRQHRSRRPAA